MVPEEIHTEASRMTKSVYDGFISMDNTVDNKYNLFLIFVFVENVGSGT